MSNQKLIPGMSYRVKIKEKSEWVIAPCKEWGEGQILFFFPGEPYFSQPSQLHEIDYTPIDPNPESEKKRLAEMLISFAKTDPVNITPYTIKEYVEEFLNRYFEK